MSGVAAAAIGWTETGLVPDRDGMKVLNLGCGWGSLSLWIAGQFPWASVRAVSNSRSQRDYVTAEASRHGIANLAIETCDMNDFAPGDTFDRIASVEMFEHMRNYDELFRFDGGKEWFVNHYRFRKAGS